VLQMWEEDPEHFAHAMETDDPFRSKAEILLLTLLEVRGRKAIHCHRCKIIPAPIIAWRRLGSAAHTPRVSDMCSSMFAGS